ncbi:MAG TPA: hypothetical protein VL979_14700 [Solirubrobacteraceae bacterium]|nr:hypothetical protein [Solirubrobacteraceae bacterium]
MTVVALLGVSVLAGAAWAQNAPRVQQEDLDVTIDAVGNATFVDKVTRSAIDWEQYKSNYGGNPSLLKRDLQHQYSSMELRDISLTNDEMNRVSVLSWKAQATAQYIGNGQWQGTIPKGAQATKVNETLWEFTTSYPDPGGITQESFHIHLPKGARGAEQTQNETGEAVLRYTLPDPAGTPLLLYVAVIAAILGAALLLAGFLGKPAAPRA